MNGSELLRVVDAIHRDKNIDKTIVFDGIEQAILSAGHKHFGEESDVVVHIDRDSGEPSVQVDGAPLQPDEIGDLLGRIAAQTAKQVIIQKIREAERDSLFDEFTAMRGHIVTGTVSRVEHGSATVNLGKVEGILPRGEQIPGDSHRVSERVRAVIIDVRKAGSRVRIILSRTHPELVRRLFEIEIPEVAEHVIEVRSLAREAGYRSKVAVSCFDNKIDCVGACVGVRGARIRSVVDELAGERIDIVRWNDSLMILVPNALQPAEVEDVILCPMLGKVIVLVLEDSLSLAIGKKGQNVRLASKLVGWDINIMTQEKLDEQLEKSVAAFSTVPEINDELAENLVAQGFFTFDDLSVIEPDQLAELGGLTAEQCDGIVAYADKESLRIEEEEKLARQQARDLERLNRLTESAAASTEQASASTEEAAADPEASEDEDTAVSEPQDAATDSESESAADAQAEASPNESQSDDTQAASEEESASTELEAANDTPTPAEDAPLPADGEANAIEDGADADVQPDLTVESAASGNDSASEHS